MRISETHWFGLAFRTNETYADAFAEMPASWMNAHILDQSGPGTGADGDGDPEKSAPQWQVKMVDRPKWRSSFRAFAERTLGVYLRGVEAAGSYEGEDLSEEERNQRGKDMVAGTAKEIRFPNGLELLPQAEWTRKHAEAWWAHRRGLEGIRFLDEERMVVVDQHGVVLGS